MGKCQIELRNRDVCSIVSEMGFDYDQSAVNDFSLTQHHCIFLGDMNYRLGMPAAEAIQHISQKDWKSLMEADELSSEQKSGRLLANWSEAPIRWAPTYRLVKDRKLDPMAGDGLSCQVLQRD